MIGSALLLCVGCLRSSSTSLRSSASSSALHSAASPPLVRTLANPTGEQSLSKLLLIKQQQQQQQQQQQGMSPSPIKSLGSSASMPALKVAPRLHATTGSTPGQKPLHRPASSAHFSPSSPLPAVTHALSILPPMSPPGIIRPTATATVAFASRRREESKDQGDNDDDDEEDQGQDPDNVDGGQSAGDFDMSSLSLASGSDLNLAEGIDLLESNLHRLLPNALIRSGKYQLQVTHLLKALRQRANQAHGESKARKAALEAALHARSVAEASESRYRASIANLQLDEWGNTDQLASDIRSLEDEIVKLGRITVEDTESVGVGLQFGIESNSAPTTAAPSSTAAAAVAGATAASNSGSSSALLLLKGRGETVAMVTSTASLRESTSKLVFTKYKRLEQLIYLLRRRLATLDNYPSQKLIEAKFGSLDNLLASQAALEAEVERLESRLAGQRLQFRTDALLRTRDLNALPPAFLHLLIASLQSSLASYTAAWDSVMGFAKETSAAHAMHPKHPLYAAFRHWSAEVDRESKKMDVAPTANTAAAAKKVLHKAAGVTGAGPVAVGVLHLSAVHDKIDIDQLWASISATAATKEGGSISKRGTTGSQATNTEQRLRHATSASASAVSTASSDVAASAAANVAALSAASSKIAALEFELGLLRKENKTLSWMQGILAKEGWVCNRSGNDLSPAIKESVERAMEGEARGADSQCEAEGEEEEEDGEEQQIEIISSTHTLGPLAGSDNDDDDREAEDAVQDESADRVAATPSRQRKPQLSVSASTPTAASSSDAAAPDSPPPTMLRAITITAPRPRELTSPKGVSAGNNGGGSLARQASIAAAASGAAATGAGSSKGLSRVSRSLLTHLQHYLTELREYKRQIVQYQQLHAARESSLAHSERDRVTLLKCMMMLLRKYPQLSEGGSIPSSNAGSGSARGGYAAAAAAGGSSSRLAPGQGGATHMGISRQQSISSLNAGSGSGRDRSKGSSPTR